MKDGERGDRIVVDCATKRVDGDADERGEEALVNCTVIQRCVLAKGQGLIGLVGVCNTFQQGPGSRLPALCCAPRTVKSLVDYVGLLGRSYPRSTCRVCGQRSTTSPSA